MRNNLPRFFKKTKKNQRKKSSKQDVVQIKEQKRILSMRLKQSWNKEREKERKQWSLKSNGDQMQKLGNLKTY